MSVDEILPLEVNFRDVLCAKSAAQRSSPAGQLEGPSVASPVSLCGKILMWLVRLVMALLIPPMFLCTVYAVVTWRVAAGRDSGALALTAAFLWLVFLALFWVDHRLARRKVCANE